MMRFLADALKPEDARFIYMFKVPPECIKAIILGCRTSKRNWRKILRVLAGNKHYSHVKAYTATTDEKLFRLNISPVET